MCPDWESNQLPFGSQAARAAQFNVLICVISVFFTSFNFSAMACFAYFLSNFLTTVWSLALFSPFMVFLGDLTHVWDFNQCLPGLL